MVIREITQYLETIAPLSYQESYDNSGLIVGDPNGEVKNVLITLDAIESVVEEAIERKCELIVAHHPIVFRGLKKLNGSNYVERTVIKAIKNDIAIYAIHTNLDNVHLGVNRKIGEKLGLMDLKVLSGKRGTLSSLVTFCPDESVDDVLEALHSVGAGSVGGYSHCSFTTSGEGKFKPREGSSPYVGEINKLEKVNEKRIEVHLPMHLQSEVLKALFESHPYEEVAYHLYQLENKNQTVGSGMIGNLSEEMSSRDFLDYVKTKMGLTIIRHTKEINRNIKKVAFCGGAGSFLLGAAKRAGADAFITGDYKYHEFFDAEDKLMILDIGHYESEVFTKDLLLEFLTEKFANIAPVLSTVDTNPVRYF